MMGYHDIPGDTKTGIGEQKKDPNYFWAQWKSKSIWIEGKDL